MQRRIQDIAIIVVPVGIALIAVLCEPRLSAWASQREAILPASMFLLLASLLQPRLRHLLVITLCYGVSFMAFRDVFRVGQLPLPENLDYDFIDQARPAGLMLVSALAFLAAIVETFRPGTVWARRCYFGAASLYFTGLGIIHVGKHGSWQAVLLCVTGVTALFGCLFAHRIVASEQEELEEPEPSDEAIQILTEAAHERRLREKEWHDHHDKPETADSASSVSSPTSPAH